MAIEVKPSKQILDLSMISSWNVQPTTNEKQHNEEEITKTNANICRWHIQRWVIALNDERSHLSRKKPS